MFFYHLVALVGGGGRRSAVGLQNRVMIGFISPNLLDQRRLTSNSWNTCLQTRSTFRLCSDERSRKFVTGEKEIKDAASFKWWNRMVCS